MKKPFQNLGEFDLHAKHSHPKVSIHVDGKLGDQHRTLETVAHLYPRPPKQSTIGSDSFPVVDKDGNLTGQWESRIQLEEAGFIHSFSCVYTRGEVWNATDIQHISASMMESSELDPDDFLGDVFGDE